ncbi:PIG-L deacetylase family protein [Kallotenue papyrolyticum]|uniref:PIG-L deacetylase family protein n=1 Tax=Kallotenue papyrolyticum TaxID=1325125 RepID=UPI00047858E2|nr:PIG-L family deacetylase [Kallotenue papyrolyticum]
MLLATLDQARAYDHLLIAPHLDDAALSCGGLIARLVDAGARVLVVTLCAGDPPPEAALSPFARYLHRAWDLGAQPMQRRRAEDARALAILGCDGLQLELLDAPYRCARYGEGDGWRGTIDPDDPLPAASRALLEQLYAHQPPAMFYVPLGVGNHVDHQIVCAAGLALHERGAPVVWYEDLPYAAKQPAALEQRLAALRPARFEPELIDISATLPRKLAAIAAYASQQRELFGAAEMRVVMTGYAAALAGGRGYAERLWRRNRVQ